MKTHVTINHNWNIEILYLLSGDTTEAELCRVFSSYGNVKSTKIIVDRAGVSKGYGFVTFETEQEAQRLQADVSSNSNSYYEMKQFDIISNVKCSVEWNFRVNV